MACFQVVIRLDQVTRSSGGIWRFRVAAEQTSCHFANPPPTAEIVAFLVVEGGRNEQQWQAGVTRVNDKDWHRFSLLQPLRRVPAIVSSVQNYDIRTKSVTTRHHLEPRIDDVLSSVFVQVLASGIWCDDGHFMGEYYANIALASSPVATDCEPGIPNLRTNASSLRNLLGAANEDTENPNLFSVRWSARISFHSEDAIVHFSSLSSASSRVKLDGVIVLDWGDGSRTSDAIEVSGIEHTLIFEYRSADDDLPGSISDTSHAELAWVVTTADGLQRNYHGQDSGHANATGTTIHADVAWLVIPASQNHESAYQKLPAGTTVAAVSFASSFAAAPHVFGTIFSRGRLGGHLRIIQSSESGLVIAAEYDTCKIVIDAEDLTVSWIALASLAGGAPEAPEGVRVVQRATAPTDAAALIAIGDALGLPAYMRWHNHSDPCADGWVGVECKADADDVPRVVVLDVHQIDLVGRGIPWHQVARLDRLEELAIWDCGVGGEIGAALCSLRALRVLVLSENNVVGSL